MDQDSRQLLLEAVTHLSTHVRPKSATRSVCLRFQADLVALPHLWHLVPEEIFVTWLQACARSASCLSHDT